VGGWVRRTSRVERDKTDPALTPQAIATDVDEDPVEPSLERRRITERPCRLPRPQQRFLGRILGFVLVAEDQTGQTVCMVKRLRREPAELFGRASRIVRR